MVVGLIPVSGLVRQPSKNPDNDWPAKTRAFSFALAKTYSWPPFATPHTITLPIAAETRPHRWRRSQLRRFANVSLQSIGDLLRSSWIEAHIIDHHGDGMIIGSEL
jgi:hypothetical protein